MHRFIRLTFVSALSLCTACASIVSGTSQKVQVSTNPPSQSYCTVANKLGNGSTTSPGQTEVHRSKTDLTVNCIDRTTGYAGSQAIESSLEPWFLGNIIFGGIIGAPIDFATGAAWQYPKEVSIGLKPTYQPAGYSATAPAASFTSPMDMQAPTAPASNYAAPEAAPVTAPAPTVAPAAAMTPGYTPAYAPAPFQPAQPYNGAH